ncbi:hypothetical protein SAMN02927895_03110 [Belnapia rosea]|nr:hypothetical protein SAMN02927895_03110 [Belnapia rosea]
MAEAAPLGKRGLAGGARVRAYALMEARVKAGIWVSMALRLADIGGRSGAVLRKGDPDAGGILCILRGRAGLVVLSQVRDAEGRPAWLRGTGPAPVDDAAADAYVARQVKRDPDLWVVEFEAPDLQPPFEGTLL